MKDTNNVSFSLFKPNKEFDEARTKANLELLEILTKYIKDNPSLRFGQALTNLGIFGDMFYEEPQIILARIKNEQQ